MSNNVFGLRESLDDSTQAVTARAPLPEVKVPALTILCHPDLDRIGEVAPLPELLSGKRMGLSRLEPLFGPPGRDPSRPLGSPRLSRSPLELRLAAGGGISLHHASSRTELEANGESVETTRAFSAPEIEAGVVLLLADRVTLLLHVLHAVIRCPPGFGMVGESVGIVRVRQEIERIADLPYSVLLIGESGTGKELAAQAIYRASSRRNGPFVSVNMGGVPASLAASELFGAAKGAFTGADRDRGGYFQEAAGGTLFLDEIGEIPLEVQVLLLRALDSGQIQPVGSKKPQTIDVRVFSATDADLRASVESGEFRSPLLHRLSQYTIEIPPLRERREDLGRLFFHFLKKEMETVGEAELVEYSGCDQRPWMSAHLMSRLAQFHWPGNVRQLQNVVRELVVGSRDCQEVQQVQQVEQLLNGTGTGAYRRPAGARSAHSEAAQPGPVASYRDLDEVTLSELTAALEAHRYVVNKAAEHLNLSRASFYKLMEKYQIRKAKDLTREEIERAWFRCRGDFGLLVDDLKVSKKGLKDRMAELGLR